MTAAAIFRISVCMPGADPLKLRKSILNGTILVIARSKKYREAAGVELYQQDKASHCLKLDNTFNRCW